MKRKKILCMTDSPKLHTGFARVGKEIFTYLQRTGKYDIACIGWFHQNTAEDVIYPIWTTGKNEKGILIQEDKYGHHCLHKYVEKFKPDLVWTLGDMWMIDHVAKCPLRNTFKWIGYFPIDGEPSPSKWGRVVEDMDIAVAYGPFGMKVIKERAPKANLKYIYHGVDTDLFVKHDAKTVEIEKKNILGVSSDKKIIGVVARNQPRKAFDKIFEAYFYILNGKYIKCNDCSKITVYPYGLITKKFTSIIKCSHCHSKDIAEGKPRDDIMIYLHCAPKDVGWELIDLQYDYNLKGKVLINPDLRIGVGVSDRVLVSIYNSFDIFTLPTRGEGFGLPILEAMSCEVPIVVTDYSAQSDWAGAGGELVPPVTLVAEPLTNIRRAIIDMNLYVTSLLRLLDDEGLRKKYGKGGREQAIKMDWKGTVRQWEKMIDGVLYPDGVPEVVRSDQVKYSLEEV